MIGGAGYSYPKEYLKTYPNAKMDVVEIDPQMTEIAKKYFRLKENPHLKIIHEDGRIFLNRAESQQYDAVLMDAFSSLFSVPFQLTTIEAVEQISRVLKHGRRCNLQHRRCAQRQFKPFSASRIRHLQKSFPASFYFQSKSRKSLIRKFKI